MLCDVTGQITYVESRKTKEGNPYLQLKVMQGDKKGNVNTIVLRVWGASEIVKGYEVGNTYTFTECLVRAYKSGIDRVGLSVDKW